MNDISVSVKFNIDDGNIIGQLNEVTSAFDDLKTSASGVSGVISGLKDESKSTSDIYADLTKNTADAFLALSKGKGALEILGKQGVNVAKSLSGVGGVLGRVAGLAAGPWGAAFLSLSGVFVELAGSIFGTGKQIEALPDNVKGALDRVGRFTNQASKAAVEQAKKDRAELQEQLAENNAVLLDLEAEQRKVEARFKRNSERASNPLADKNGSAAIAAGKDAARLEELKPQIEELSRAEEEIKASLKALNLKEIEENIQGELDAFTKARLEFEKGLHEQRLAFERDQISAEEFEQKFRELDAKRKAAIDQATGPGSEFDFNAPENSFNPEDFCVKVETPEGDDVISDATADVIETSENQVETATLNQNAAQANQKASEKALMAADSLSGAVNSLANGILPGETAGVPDGISLGGPALPFGDLVEQLQALFTKIPEDFQGLVRSIPEALNGVIGNITSIFTSLPETFTGLFQQIQGLFGSGEGSIFGQINKAFSSLFGSGEDGLIGGIRKAFGSIFGTGEGSVIANISTAFRDLFSGGEGLFSGLVESIGGIFGNVGDSFSGLLSGFEGLFKGLGKDFGGIFNGLVDNFQGLFQRDGALGEIFSDLTKNFKGLFSEDGPLQSIFGNLSQGFSNLLGQFGGPQGLLGNLGQGIQSLFGQGGGLLGSIFGQGGPLSSIGSLFGKDGAVGSLFGSNGLIGGLFKEGGVLGGITNQLSGLLGGLGNSLSGVFSSLSGNLLGTALGSAVPIIGNLAGGFLSKTIGKLFGGLFGGTKKGLATINTTSSGELRLSDVRGKGKGRTEQARELGTAVFSELQRIAEALGGGITGGLNLGSIGTRKSRFIFDPTGQSRSKGHGVQSFKTAEEAVFAALRRALSKGAVAGISNRVQQALTSTSDISSALQKALDVQEFENYLEGIKEPMRNVFLEFERQAKERLDRARQFGFGLAQIEEFNAKERAEILEAELARTVGSLKDLLDELTFGDLAGGTPQERLDRLRAEQAEAAAAVRNGDEGAAEDFAAITREILAISEQLFGSAGQFGQDLGLSRSEVEQLIAQAEADIAEQQHAAREEAGTLPEQQLAEANASLDDIARNTALMLQAFYSNGGYGGGGVGSVNFNAHLR